MAFSLANLDECMPGVSNSDLTLLPTEWDFDCLLEIFPGNTNNGMQCIIHADATKTFYTLYTSFYTHLPGFTQPASRFV